MSSNEKPADDKVYRFISDPAHKENLSGRVRAACITCRRKKIKCSGEVPCSTCKEKGIACEGLKDRKKPKRNQDHCRVHDDAGRATSSSSKAAPQPARPARSRQVSLDTNASSIARPATNPQRPTDALKKMHAVSSADSGYSSGHLPLDSRLASYDNSGDISPSTYEPHDWSFVQRQASSKYSATETAESDVSNNTHVASRTGSIGWPALGEWWRAGSSGNQAATNLVSAARLLEEQARSLRRMAAGQQAQQIEDTRRQTIAFPLHPPSSESTGFSPLFSPTALDDMALLFADRPLASGPTPMASDCASWWDMNAGLDTSTSLSQGSGSEAFLPGPELVHSDMLAAIGTDWRFPTNPNTQTVTASPSKVRSREEFMSAVNPDNAIGTLQGRPNTQRSLNSSKG